MRIVHEEGDFYSVYDATSSVRKYLKLSVPTTHRRYESEPVPRWVVHRKYLDNIAPDAWREKRDPHTVLFLTNNAPGFMIDAAWRALALKHHPDHGGDPEAFREAKAAYEELNGRDNDGSSP
jgi:hypothetical protein